MNGKRVTISLVRREQVFQAPNPKPQVPEKHQEPICKSFPGGKPTWLLMIGYSLGIGIWNLVFMKSFWLVKSEPSSYSWQDLKTDGKTSWTGVRNFTARNNLRAMRKGDDVLFYHSVDEKAVVGIARVTRTAYRDNTAKEGDWSTVDLAPVKPLRRPVTLGEIKENRQLKNISLVRQSRLSVMPLTAKDFQAILRMSK